MPDLDDVDRHLELIRLRRHGSWIVAREPSLRAAFLDHLSRTGAFSAAGLARLKSIRNGGSAGDFDDIFRGLLAEKASFSNPAQWTLYWALSEATHGILGGIEAGCHEPTLTGSLMTHVRTSLKQVGTVERGPAEPLEDVVGFHFADHAAGWKESKTGADFGVVMEIHDGASMRYVVTLVQAKRMPGARAVDRDQLQAVYLAGIGSYLFYNEAAFGGAAELTTPTTKTAEMVKIEMRHKGVVDPFAFAGDLAVRLALELPGTSSLLGAGEYRSPQEALAALYSLDRQVRIDQVLVTVLGERRFTSAEVVEREGLWRSLVDRARGNVRAGRKPFDDGPPLPDREGVDPAP